MNFNKYRFKKISKKLFILITLFSASILNNKLISSEENINWQIIKKENSSNILNWEKVNDNYYLENYQTEEEETNFDSNINYKSDSIMV